jgi:hypothetical protein
VGLTAGYGVVKNSTIHAGYGIIVGIQYNVF